MFINTLTYLLFRSVGFFISLLSYKAIYRVGMVLGAVVFIFHRSFRKKAMTNLAICYGDKLDEKGRKRIARRSFQNIMITCLEFFRLKKSKGNIEEIVHLKNNPKVVELLEKGQGVIFLSAHQGNWEIPFIALTEKYAGIAIGRPIKNKRLYDYIMSVRQMHGGTIIMPKQATSQGIKALKAGKFLGIVGDQAYPQSSYSYPLFGTRAWTTASPALLAYKTNCPIVVGTNRRIKGHYIVAGSDPIWPDLTKPLREEMPRMMDLAMQKLETSIKNTPHQWMWIHDRFKQQTINEIKRKYRFAFVLIILPPDTTDYLATLSLLKRIYERSFITCFVPEGVTIEEEGMTFKNYSTPEELLIRDWRFQILFDFADLKGVQRHFKKLGVFEVLTLKKLQKHGPNLEQAIQQECLKTVSI